MGRGVRTLCRAIRATCEAGAITRQQARTLTGQAKHGDEAGAREGLRRILDRRSREGA